MNAKPIAVVLIDDHAIVRRGMKAYLSAQDGIAVKGEAASGEAALAHIAEWAPDVVLMDAHMPGGMSGIEATRRVKALLPHAQIILLSGFTDEARVIGALRAGAITYLPKDCEPETVLAAVRAAARGEAVIDREIMARVAQAETQRHSDALSAREMDVLRLVVEGLTNAEIGARLHVGDETVKTHLAAIMRKLGLNHRTQVAVFALKSGLVA